MIKEYIDPTRENAQMILDKIAAFAEEKKLTVTGELRLNRELEFPSLSQKKVIRNYLTKLNTKMTKSQASRFLHALKRYAPNLDAQVNLSSKEISIQLARKEWKIARDKADQLLKVYKETKGNFYK